MAKVSNKKPNTSTNTANKAIKTVVKQESKKTAPVAAQAAKQKIRIPHVYLLAIILAFVAIAAYYNTHSGGYVLDDVMVLKDNKIVRKGISAIPELLSTPHLLGYLKLGNDTYRPLSLVFYAFVFQFAEDNTTAYHFLNILAFAGCVVGLFFFLNKLFNRERTTLAFMASLLFAVHPLHTEVVANIKSLDELLCFLFAFVALNFYADYAKSGKMQELILGSIALFLSYISKETVIAFVGIIPIIFFFYLNENKTRSVLVSASSTIVAGVFLLVRWMILTKYHANVHSNINFVDNFLVRSPTPVSRLATEIFILGKYFWLHVVPYPLISDYSFRSIPYLYFNDYRVWLSLLLYVGLIAIAVYRLLKIKSDPLGFGIIFYLGSIVLFSNIPVTIGSALAERFTFYCSAGYCLLPAFALEKWVVRSSKIAWITEGFNDKKFTVFAILIPITLVLFYLTVSRNEDWLTDFNLYQADIEKSPDNTRLGYDYANEMEKRYEAEKDPVEKQKMIQKSMNALRRSLAIYPYYSDAHLELGVDYFNVQNYDSAEAHFKASIQYNPKQSNAMFNLATIYLRQNRWQNALEYYKKTIEVNPDRFPAIFNEGVSYYQLQKYDSAILDFKKSLSLSPSYYNYKGYGYVAIVYKTIGNLDSSRVYEALAKKYEPGFKM